MDTVRPLVTVKCKQGELEALGKLSNQAADNVRLMVELLDQAGPDSNLIRNLVDAAVELAQVGRMLWIDTIRLTADSRLTQVDEGVFEFLDNRIDSEMTRKFGPVAAGIAHIVPVVPIDASDDQLRDVRSLIEQRDRDLVIRISRPISPARELVRRAQHIVRASGARVDRVQVVIDVGFIGGVSANRARWVTWSARVLASLLDPRSMTVLSGSIPPERTTYETTERPRAEIPLWNAVRESGAGDISYGDYGVTHAVPPQPSQYMRPPNPYLCYTVPRKTVVLRRKLAAGDKAADGFTDLVEELVERTDFAGPAYSWGDRELAACLTGRKIGSAPKWVALATSHHIEHVCRRTATDL